MTKTNNFTPTQSLSQLYSLLHDTPKTQKQVYARTQVSLGYFQNPIDQKRRRADSTIVLGTALGDEGKGRVVLNLIQKYQQNKRLKSVYVIRFQGGNNAGHTLQVGSKKWAQHQVPSGIHLDRVIGVMDSGMVIHLEDLYHEVKLIEQITDVKLDHTKLQVSADAIACTDLDRAKEVLNRQLSQGSKGGTGRGIGPAYASHYDRLGLRLKDIVGPEWKSKVTLKYKQAETLFKAFGEDLSQIEVPDFSATKTKNTAQSRTLGDLNTFLKRLESARKWCIKNRIIVNTFETYTANFENSEVAFLFEGAQAIGLDAWIGTRPDITASNTTISGISSSTKYWLPSMVERRIGVFKATYTSSVGSRRMPTHIDLPHPLPSTLKLNSDQKTALFIRTQAHEFGSTTGRPRDIVYLDLEFLGYNAVMGGVEALVATHVDIAQPDKQIKVCVGYENQNGEKVHYQPGLDYLEDISPIYISLPGWDGQAVSQAKSISELPHKALQFLKFIEQSLGLPIVAITTGPKDSDIIFC